MPIVNENDTVSFDEIRFGDNDIISAHIANMLDADLLVMLTDTDGVFDMNPKTHADARVLRTVEKVTDAVLAGAEGKGSSFSSGGMESKIRAADIATRSGVGVVIARGEGLDLPGILEGQGDRDVVRAHGAPHEGAQEVDGVQPAARKGPSWWTAAPERAILKQGRSLLPAGVKEIRGSFAHGQRGLHSQDEDGSEVARGLSNFSSEELEKIRGLNTKKIPEILGEEAYFDEVVHRDNLVDRREGHDMSRAERLHRQPWRARRRRPPIGLRDAERGRKERGAARSIAAAIDARRQPSSGGERDGTWSAERRRACPPPCWTG